MAETSGRTGARVGQALDDRVLVTTSSRLPAGLVDVIRRHGLSSGLMIVGSRAVSVSRSVRAVRSDLFVGVDTEAYGAYSATPSRPFKLPEDGEGTLVSCGGLREFIGNVAANANVVLTPTGVIGVGDEASLAAAVDMGNEVEHPACVVSVPVPAAWLRPPCLPVLLRQLVRCTKPVAVTVIAQLDPFEDAEVADGVLAVAAVGAAVHRTDMSAIQLLLRGARAATIGLTASLRHTVPPLRRPSKRRKQTDRSLAVFVPGINEFRDVAQLEAWYNDGAPGCATPACCGRKLTDFDPKNEKDRAQAELHNMANVLGVVEQMLSAPNRMAWLRGYRDEVETAYEALRLATGVRGIQPYAGAKYWLSLTD